MSKEIDELKTHVDTKFAIVQESLDKFYKAIFEGNGEPGLKTQVEILSRVVKGILWLGGVLTASVIVCVVELWFKK